MLKGDKNDKRTDNANTFAYMILHKNLLKSEWVTDSWSEREKSL